MLKRLWHPDHGVHIVYTSIDYETCLKNGWIDEADKPVAKELKTLRIENGNRKHNNLKSC